MVLGFKSQTPDIWVVTTRLEQGCWWHLPPQKQFLPRGYFLKVYLGSNVFKLRILGGPNPDLVPTTVVGVARHPFEWWL